MSGRTEAGAPTSNRGDRLTLQKSEKHTWIPMGGERKGEMTANASEFRWAVGCGSEETDVSEVRIRRRTGLIKNYER